MIAPSEPDGVTGQLCNWISGLQSDDIPLSVKERAKYLMLDGITCALVGSHLPWSKTAVEALCDFEGRGPCTLIGWDDIQLGPLNAALLNSTFIQGFELDDYYSVAPLHNNSIILPALLALAELMEYKNEKRITGEQFLLSTIVGYEVGPRVGLALHGAAMLTRGWHSGPIFGPAASAAATSKLLGLPPRQIEYALGTACTQACGLMSAQFGAMGKRMQHGFAAKNGLFASLMSKGNDTGITQVLERPYGGFLSTYSLGGKAALVDEVTKELGQTWLTMNINVKAYAYMAGLHSTIDCFNELHASHKIQASEIKSISIELSEAAFHHGGWTAQHPLTETGAQMNVAYTASACILDGRIILTHFAPKMINRKEIWDLIHKVQVLHQSDFDKDPQLGYRARVKITMQNNEVIEATVDKPKGLKEALSNDEIREKFRASTTDVISVERQRSIEEAILNIDSANDLSDLFNLLKPNVKNIFG
jgi:aconitate decarboxylase